jgi:26S proteasome regulatory subunit N1
MAMRLINHALHFSSA